MYPRQGDLAGVFLQRAASDDSAHFGTSLPEAANGSFYRAEAQRLRSGQRPQWGILTSSQQYPRGSAICSVRRPSPGRPRRAKCAVNGPCPWAAAQVQSSTASDDWRQPSARPLISASFGPIAPPRLTANTNARLGSKGTPQFWIGRELVRYWCRYIERSR